MWKMYNALSLSKQDRENKMYEELKVRLRQDNILTNKGQINKKAQHLLSMSNRATLLLEVNNATSFLDKSSTDTLRIRLYCILNDITELPTCKVCGGPVTFKGKGGFNSYCANSKENGSCAAKDKELQASRLDTIRKKYGVDNPMQNKSVRQRAVDTLVDRYGVDVPAKSTKIRQKTKNTLLKKYGVDAIAHIPSVAGKRRQTNIEKYGAPTYAEGYLSQDTLDVLNNKDRLIEMLKDFPRRDIAMALGISSTTLYSRLKAHGVDLTEYESQTQITSIPQREIMGELDRLDIKYIANDRSLISPKHLDIYIPSHNLAIEFDGIYYHSERFGRDRNYHLSKTIACQNNNTRLIHVWSNEWYQKREIVISRIRNALGVTATRIYARKCVIKALQPQDVREFFNRCHIQGSLHGKVVYGLFFNNKLVAAMNFTVARYTKGKYEWELLRYASALDTIIVGGASKLFKHFVENHQPTNVVSYCDLRWGTGNMYEQLGFTFSHRSTPNYYYFQATSNTEQLFSRVQFQKHKLANKLDTFDPNLTEWENMVNNGYDRIWDCGNGVYVWTM